MKAPSDFPVLFLFFRENGCNYLRVCMSEVGDVLALFIKKR